MLRQELHKLEWAVEVRAPPETRCAGYDGRPQAEKRLRSEVNRLARNVYGLKSDAFAHFAVQESFDLEFEDDVEYCNVGGA
jgi:hypothetical protein